MRDDDRCPDHGRSPPTADRTRRLPRSIAPIVNSSSSWSTTTTGVPGADARAVVIAPSGSTPGVNTATVRPAADSPGTRPARTSDDLPQPDGPATTRTDVPLQAAEARRDLAVPAEERLGVTHVVRQESLVRAVSRTRQRSRAAPSGSLS